MAASAGNSGVPTGPPSVRKSIAGSVVSASTAARRNMAAEFDFNLGVAKNKVLKASEERLPAGFAHFFQGALFDRLLHGLTLYFCATFQHEALARVMERSRQSHVEGYNPYLVAARLQELEQEAAAQLAALSPPYCEAIMKHSSFKKPQQDRHFFEALYAALAAVLGEAFERLGKAAALQVELGRLFRGRHFNKAARLHGPPRSVDSLTVAQIWSLKNETPNRSLAAKLIRCLGEKPPSLAVQVAGASHSPLVSQAVSSPLVARALLADPQQRDALLAAPGSRGLGRGVPAAQRLHGAVRGVAAAQGVDLSALASPCGLRQLQPTPGTLLMAGIVTSKPEAAPGARETAAANSNSSPRGPAAAGSGPTVAALAVPPSPAGGASGRPSCLKPFQATVAALPEAAGLPYDEAFAYLCLLRRYILYGPTLGLATALIPQAASSRTTSMSLTGAAWS